MLRAREVLAPPPRPALPDLEVVMHERKHRPVKHWWSRHYRCACGQYLDRCTTYWAQVARTR